MPETTTPETIDLEAFALTAPPDAEPEAETQTGCFDCCGAERDEDDWSCHNCASCKSCCSCWCCAACENNQDEHEYSCSNCNYCSSCCECFTCNNCDEPHSTDDYCDGCDYCQGCCTCSEQNEDEEQAHAAPGRASGRCTYCSRRTLNRCRTCYSCPNCARCYACLSLTYDQAVTQKARGLFSLDVRGHASTQFWCHSAKALLTREIADEYFPLFARPCPEFPAHGFVNSRIVNSNAELKALAAEALAADPVAEIILMLPIEAITSAIWLPGSLTIGPGNDGATAGRNCVVLPVCGELVPPNQRERAGITDTPYVEVVADAEHPWLVQLRNGPHVSATTDYIPATLTVRRVVKANADALKVLPWNYWEKLVAELPQDQGVVVWHQGGALSSHYAVHATLHKLPVVTSHEPVVGEILEPTVDAAAAPSIARLRDGFAAALSATLANDMPHYGESTSLMLAACHNAALWAGRQDYLLGFGMGLGFRLTLLACLGELRHERRPYRPISHCGPDMPLSRITPPRSQIFDALWPRAATARLRLAVAAKHFVDGNARRPESCGGLAWYCIARAGIELHNALVDGDYTLACEKFNVLVNCVHNSGWTFDKFLPKASFNEAAACGASPAIHAMNLLYAAATGDFKAPADFRWAKLPVPEVVAAKPKPEPEDEEEDEEYDGPIAGECQCPACQQSKKDAIKAIPWEAVKAETQPAAAPTPRVAVAAQVKVHEGHIWAQIAYETGPRKPSFRVNYDQYWNTSYVAPKIAVAVASGNTVPSMAGSSTLYVPLVKQSSGWWTLNDEVILYAP